VTAGAFNGVGGAFGNVTSIGERIAKIVVHGAVGGLSSVAQGGKFGSGFLSSGFTEAFAPGIARNISSVPGQVAAAAVVGGTASEIGGGKFANGAVTGAFSYTFNHLAHSMDQRLQDALGRLASRSATFRTMLRTLNQSEKGWEIRIGSFDNIDVGNTTIEGGVGKIRIDPDDFSKYSLVDSEGSRIALTVDRVLAHEIGHAYVIETQNISMAAEPRWRLEATILENKVMQEAYPGAQMRSWEDDGHRVLRN
jgi:hypothetical protein